MLGRVIDEKYRIVRALARGGMGSVYEAQHIATRRSVALKVLLREAPEAQRRFALEALAAGSIASQHVVQVLDAGLDRASRTPYLVMELLRGLDLRELLARRRVLCWQDVLRIAAQACSGLARAHAQGIVHRDIKPANLFLARDEAGQPVLKLLDFGVAKLRQAPWAATEAHHLTASGSLLGSPLYMSPEQALGCADLDGRSDLWSLGVVMYQALCGETPHGSAPLGALVLRICAEPAWPLREHAPEVPAAVAEIVHKALALDRAQRFQSAQELLACVRTQLAGSAALPEALWLTPGAAGALAASTQDGPGASSECAGSSVTRALEATLPAEHTRSAGGFALRGEAEHEPRASTVGSRAEPRASTVGSRAKPRASTFGSRAEPHASTRAGAPRSVLLGRAALAALTLLSGARESAPDNAVDAGLRSGTISAAPEAVPAASRQALAPPSADLRASAPRPTSPVSTAPDERLRDVAARTQRVRPAARRAGRQLSQHVSPPAPSRPAVERLTIDREM